MLKVMMEVKGPFTKKMLRKGAFVEKHFENDQNMSFALMEDDPITKTKVGGWNALAYTDLGYLGQRLVIFYLYIPQKA
jgi:hypothetical protein